MTKTKTKQKSLFDYYGFTEKDAKKYPVVSRILKQLTPERVKKENEAINAVKLPTELQKWVKEYEKVGCRDEFIWKWAYHIAQIVTSPTISNISKNYLKTLVETKFLMIMMTVLCDDVSDKMRNKNLLEEISKIFSNITCIKLNLLNKEEKNYFKLCAKIWNQIQKNIKKYPRFKEFKELFEYDVNQTLNAIKYSYLINKNLYLINKTESWLYLPHNMLFLVHFMIDLMCNPQFRIEELGMLREIAHAAQKMGRICNWIATWKREIKEGDFTNGIFPYAIEKKVCSPGELYQKGSVINKIAIAHLEYFLLKEWETNFNRIKAFNNKIKHMDIKKILQELEKFLILDLISIGYK